MLFNYIFCFDGLYVIEFKVIVRINFFCVLVFFIICNLVLLKKIFFFWKLLNKFSNYIRDISLYSEVFILVLYCILYRDGVFGVIDFKCEI